MKRHLSLLRLMLLSEVMKAHMLAYLLDGEDALLLLDVGGDDVVEEEEGLGVRRHVDVVLKVGEERAVHHRLGVVLRRQFVTLRETVQVSVQNKITKTIESNNYHVHVGSMP